MNGYMSHDTALDQLRVPQLIRALGQPFIIVPLSSLATGNLGPAQQPQASAIFNMMRNLGGSIGIAILSTFTTIREQFHFSIIAKNVTMNSLTAQQQIAELARSSVARSGPLLARVQALASLRDTVRREAFVMAYSDCFFAMGVIMAIGIVALLIVPKPKSAGEAARPAQRSPGTPRPAEPIAGGGWAAVLPGGAPSPSPSPRPRPAGTASVMPPVEGTPPISPGPVVLVPAPCGAASAAGPPVGLDPAPAPPAVAPPGVRFKPASVPWA
jgi:hypothetical protein